MSFIFSLLLLIIINLDGFQKQCGRDSSESSGVLKVKPSSCRYLSYIRHPHPAGICLISLTNLFSYWHFQNLILTSTNTLPFIFLFTYPYTAWSAVGLLGPTPAGKSENQEVSLARKMGLGSQHIPLPLRSFPLLPFLGPHSKLPMIFPWTTLITNPRALVWICLPTAFDMEFLCIHSIISILPTFRTAHRQWMTPYVDRFQDLST